MIHRFGPFEADEERFELRRAGRVVSVQRLVLEAILFLARSGGRLVTRQDLIEGPWRGTVVSDAAFSQAIMQARRALAPEGAVFIVTVRGKGWRWNGASGVVSDGREARVALDASERLIDLGERRDDPWRLLDARLARAQFLLELGRSDGFAEEADRHAALAARARHQGHLWFARVLLATRRHQEARIEEAGNALWQSLPEGRATVGPGADGVVAAHLFNLALQVRGSLRRRMLERVQALVQRCREREPNVVVWQTLLAVTRLQLGDRSGARLIYAQLARRIPGLGEDRDLLPCLVSLVDLAIAFRDGDGLRVIGDRLSPHAGLRICRDFADWGPVSFHLGRVARERGDGPASRRLFDQALAENETAGARCWQHWSGYAFARALAGTGRSGDARRSRQLLRATSAAARTLRIPALALAASMHEVPSPESFLGRAA